MNAHVAPRGGTPVGVLADLSVVEAGAVHWLRAWCSGVEGRRALQSELAAAFGTRDGGDLYEAVGALCELCIRHARRPLTRHHRTCDCVGADEACFATFVAAAAEGDREDALMIACVMVRADVAMALVPLAERAGLAVQRRSLAQTRRPVRVH